MIGKRAVRGQGQRLSCTIHESEAQSILIQDQSLMYCAGQAVFLPGTRYDVVKGRSGAIVTLRERAF